MISMTFLRRLTGLFLALLLMLPLAQAATLLQEPSAPAGAVLNIQSAFSRHAYANAQALMDQQPWTFFACTGEDKSVQGMGIDFSLQLSGETVDGLWILSGVGVNEESFRFYARPRILQLIISHQGGRSQYRFLMEDVFDTFQSNSAWQNGYQRLELPRALSGVTQIDCIIESWYPGASLTDTVCISDLKVTGAAGSIYQPAPPTAAPNWGLQPQGVYTLSQKLSTRSGPGTGYEEYGTFLNPGDQVTLISRYYNSNDEIWWVQAEFTYQGATRRVYTGAKRIKEDTSLLPVEAALGAATVLADMKPLTGPGEHFAPLSGTVKAGQQGKLWAYENGYAQFEYRDQEINRTRRVWIPQEWVRLN